jgi:hypothetical protein
MKERNSNEIHISQRNHILWCDFLSNRNFVHPQLSSSKLQKFIFFLLSKFNKTRLFQHLKFP